MEKLILQLATELKQKRDHVENVVRLIDDGNTIPFIARYRKELHGTMNDQLLREIADRLQYLRNLDARRVEIISAIDSQGKLTSELVNNINSASTLAKLEDVYRPYKQKRRTRATIARENGLEPLAALLIKQTMTAGSLKAIAVDYVNQEKGINTPDNALSGASYIVAEDISDDAEIRELLREHVLKHGRLVSVGTTEKDSVYRLYYDFSESLSRMQSHRVLAINRGEKENFLKVAVHVDADVSKQIIMNKVLRQGSKTTELIWHAVEDSYDRLIFPSLEREMRKRLTDMASEQAIKLFALNLKSTLMQPPVNNIVTMGFDPAYRTGCKIAVVDSTGKLLETTVIYPTPPHNKMGESRMILSRMISKHNIKAIAIGNGTASKESEIFIAELLKEHPGVAYMVVNEAGASVYSASTLGSVEFPSLDVSLRSAVSIARRLQDPLAELVKIDPKSIGVGQYQHDMSTTQLDGSLSNVVESCVNAVGVNINTASPSLLSFVSGLNITVANNIVKYREENGAFSSRTQIKKVPKIGNKTFEQCAGFLRIATGKSILDNTGVHPESYKAAEKILDICGYSLTDVETGNIKNLRDRVKEISVVKVVEFCGVGEPTINDIVIELSKPGRDPRDELPPTMLRSDIMDINDLKTGLVIRGTVRNVIDFGAFIDIGVHQDGLVHISELSNRFINHPSEVVKVGDIVNVMVLSVDVDKKRVSLSMKRVEKQLFEVINYSG